MPDLFRPLVACDVVLFDCADPEDPRTLLITRRHPPYQGCHAFPGGLLDEGESVEQCAVRELKEETAVEGIELQLVGIWSVPGRDPRGPVVSITFGGLAKGSQIDMARAGDDAATASWVPISSIVLDELAFDHDEMLAAARAKLNV